MTVSKEGFRIELACPFPGWWRYNVALMCGCFDAAGERTGFASAEDTVAEAGSAADGPTADYPADRKSVLDTPPCERIELYVYVIPHTLPTDREVEVCHPFDADLRIYYDGKPLRSEKIAVNQWSGASATWTVDRK